MNPYVHKTFWQFFAILFHRVYLLLKGAPLTLAIDELQLLTLCGVACSSALIGCFLILRRMTMLANALSHTLLLGIVIAYLLFGYFGGAATASTLAMPLSLFLLASCLTALVTAFITQLLTHTLKLQEDASIGLVFTSLFALGVILVTLFTRNTHIGTEIIMGNVDMLDTQDLLLPWVSCGCNILSFALFFKEFQATSFDAPFARAAGIPPSAFHYLLMIQVSLTLVACFRSVGVLLVLAFIVGPVLIVRPFIHRLHTLILLAPCIGMALAALGVALSRHLLTCYDMPLSTSGLVVCLLGAAYALALIALEMKKRRAPNSMRQP